MDDAIASSYSLSLFSVGPIISSQLVRCPNEVYDTMIMAYSDQFLGGIHIIRSSIGVSDLSQTDSPDFLGAVALFKAGDILFICSENHTTLLYIQNEDFVDVSEKLPAVCSTVCVNVGKSGNEITVICPHEIFTILSSEGSLSIKSCVKVSRRIHHACVFGESTKIIVSTDNEVAIMDSQDPQYELCLPLMHLSEISCIQFMRYNDSSSVISIGYFGHSFSLLILDNDLGVRQMISPVEDITFIPESFITLCNQSNYFILAGSRDGRIMIMRLRENNSGDLEAVVHSTRKLGVLPVQLSAAGESTSVFAYCDKSWKVFLNGSNIGFAMVAGDSISGAVFFAPRSAAETYLVISRGFLKHISLDIQGINNQFLHINVCVAA